MRQRLAHDYFAGFSLLHSLHVHSDRFTSIVFSASRLSRLELCSTCVSGNPRGRGIVLWSCHNGSSQNSDAWFSTAVASKFQISAARERRVRRSPSSTLFRYLTLTPYLYYLSIPSPQFLLLVWSMPRDVPGDPRHLGASIFLCSFQVGQMARSTDGSSIKDWSLLRGMALQPPPII